MTELCKTYFPKELREAQQALRNPGPRDLGDGEAGDEEEEEAEEEEMDLDRDR
jgi:hypothetical protein